MTVKWLLAYDGSEAADEALWQASQTLEGCEGHLEVYRAIAPEDLGDDWGAVDFGRATSPKTQKRLQMVLDRLERTVAPMRAEFPDLDIATSVSLGHPVAAAIAARAEDVGADLLVVSSARRWGLHRWLAPSVAEAVAEQSVVPTLIFSPRVESWVRYPPEHIVVALDLSPEAQLHEADQRAIHAAAEVARIHDARLTLLHVMTAPPGDDDRTTQREEQRKEEVRKRLFDLRDVAGQLTGGTRVDIDIRRAGQAGKTVAQVCEELRADLLITAPDRVEQETSPDRVSSELSRSAPCPVLVSRVTR